MKSFRSIAAATLAAAFMAAGSGFASADPPPGHGHGRGHEAVQNGSPRSHAVVNGSIVGIDYGSASIIVETPQGRVPIAVTPSTSIFRGGSFASFADLARGAHVSVDVSEMGGRLVAQIIRIH